MSNQNDKVEDFRRFAREIAEVMDRHREVSRNFVLAEADPADMEADLGFIEGEFPMAEVASEVLLEVMEAPPRKICIRFGIDPRTGRRVCLQWVDAR